MGSFLSSISVESLDELLSPTSLLVAAAVVVVYYFLSLRQEPEAPKEDEPTHTPIEKRDMTVAELLEYNGTDPSKPILLAVCGKIYDVTKGKDFYGPGGPYAVLAGHDATRGLATMDASPSAVKDTDDDYSDLSSGELNQAQEWSQTFAYKYDIIGKLLKASDVKKDESVEKHNSASETEQAAHEEREESVGASQGESSADKAAVAKEATETGES